MAISTQPHFVRSCAITSACAGCPGNVKVACIGYARKEIAKFDACLLDSSKVFVWR